MSAKLLVCFVIFLVLLDCVTITSFRRLLVGILVDARNRKSANRIYKEQTCFSKFTLSYIPDYLKKNIQYFKKFHFLYLVDLYSIVPQYFILGVFTAFWPIQSRYLYCLFVGIKILMNIIIRFQVDSLWRPNNLKE